MSSTRITSIHQTPSHPQSTKMLVTPCTSPVSRYQPLQRCPRCHACQPAVISKSTYHMSSTRITSIPQTASHPQSTKMLVTPCTSPVSRYLVQPLQRCPRCHACQPAVISKSTYHMSSTRITSTPQTASHPQSTKMLVTPCTWSSPVSRYQPLQRCPRCHACQPAV